MRANSSHIVRLVCNRFRIVTPARRLMMPPKNFADNVRRFQEDDRHTKTMRCSRRRRRRCRRRCSNTTRNGFHPHTNTRTHTHAANQPKPLTAEPNVDGCKRGASTLSAQSTIEHDARHATHCVSKNTSFRSHVRSRATSVVIVVVVLVHSPCVLRARACPIHTHVSRVGPVVRMRAPFNTNQRAYAIASLQLSLDIYSRRTPTIHAGHGSCVSKCGCVCV